MRRLNWYLFLKGTTSLYVNQPPYKGINPHPAFSFGPQKSELSYKYHVVATDIYITHARVYD